MTEDSTIILNISDNVRALKKSSGLSNRAISKKLHISLPTWNRILYGTTQTTIFNYVRIAELFQVSLNDLVEVKK